MPSQLNAFEITEEDVENVLKQMGKALSPDEVAGLFERLDKYSVVDCALFGMDIYEQTDYAYKEIRSQLEKMLK